MNKTFNTPSLAEDSHEVKETSNEVIIYLHALYNRHKGCSLIKPCIHKIKSNCRKERSITFRVLHDATKIDFFCSTKDETPTLNQSSVAYEFVSSG